MKTKNFSIKNKGFTLIELMVAIAILAILVAIAYPSYQNYVQRGRLEIARTEIMENIKNIEQKYFKNRTTCKDDCSSTATVIISAANKGSSATEGKYYKTEVKLFSKTEQKAAGVKADFGSYAITSQPQPKYADANKQLYLIYQSRNNSFIKCNEAGFKKIKENLTASTSNNNQPKDGDCTIE